MELNLTNPIKYNNLLLQIFNCNDIPTLMIIKEELIIRIETYTYDISLYVKINRLILLVECYITILNNDLRKLN